MISWRKTGATPGLNGGLNETY